MADASNGMGDLIRGAAAGVAATWVMSQVTTWMYENEDPVARRREDTVRGERTAYAIAAEKSAALVGRELTRPQSDRAGNAIHWALGAGSGAAYAGIRHRIPHADAGHGAVFGLALFLAMDEGANAGLGLTPGPLEFPWQAHARGLVGHLVFGVAAETALRLLDRVG